MKQLSQGQQDTCTYLGIFGCLITATVIIQHMLITRTHWLTFVLLAIYFFVLASFILLALKNYLSPVLLSIGTGAMLFSNVMILKYNLISAVVLILFLYLVVVILLLFMGNYPTLLHKVYMAKKAEEREWEGKL